MKPILLLTTFQLVKCLPDNICSSIYKQKISNQLYYSQLQSYYFDFTEPNRILESIRNNRILIHLIRCKFGSVIRKPLYLLLTCAVITESLIMVITKAFLYDLLRARDFASQLLGCTMSNHTRSGVATSRVAAGCRLLHQSDRRIWDSKICSYLITGA